MYAKKNSGKKALAMLLAVVLLIGVGVGGTLAWLMDTSNSVTNTFTVGDIAIELKEHELKDGALDQNSEVTEQNNYKILPKGEEPKDPFVRFTKDSEACWLFVKVEEKNNTVTGKDYKYVTYTVDAAIWTPLGDNYPGIYYKDLTAAGVAKDAKYDILTDDKVTYNENLTKEELAAAANAQPELKFTGYAIQKDAAATAEAAWALVKDNAA